MKQQTLGKRELHLLKYSQQTELGGECKVCGYEKTQFLDASEAQRVIGKESPLYVLYHGFARVRAPVTWKYLANKLSELHITYVGFISININEKPSRHVLYGFVLRQSRARHILDSNGHLTDVNFAAFIVYAFARMMLDPSAVQKYACLQFSQQFSRSSCAPRNGATREQHNAIQRKRKSQEFLFFIKSKTSWIALNT